MNSVPPTFLRETWDNFWQKELEMLGAQEIQNREVYSDHTFPDEVFGFIPRHDDYRRVTSHVSGEFRTTLSFWHMARNFTSDPALNSTFVNADPTNRIYADTNSDQLQCMISHQLTARRLVSGRARNA
jgi:hypothetical protein